ncbi:MAG: hypothetical protein ACI9RZ_001995, partial [Sphingobacteriales bacterium]
YIKNLVFLSIRKNLKLCDKVNEKKKKRVSFKLKVRCI